jgi:hypothetical protein
MTNRMKNTRREYRTKVNLKEDQCIEMVPPLKYAILKVVKDNHNNNGHGERDD